MVDAARPAQDVFKKQAEEWFVRGHHDIETAQLLYEQDGYVDSRKVRMIWIGRGNLSTKFRPRLNNQISQFLRSFAFTE